ncbi:MAG: 4-(cytidine 5'-diphospho)-2-C-methyl-D-erythritol kinase [Chitinophagaceae bacterium]|nr:4-(cytidine 5'-diphospho)-2-C-methyl-D-erythritol kinase [Chitinophagaceae bacterium]
MVSFPNCKINLGLYITRKREDGYHDLETVFYPLPLKDALEIIRRSDDEIRFTQTGLEIPGDSSDNLCMKAYRLLKKDFPQIGGVEMHLHKKIPMGAGLGGGSADGAFTLKMLNKLFQLGLPEEQLLHYALQLGSDCPFFIRNRPCLAAGRGEAMKDIDLDFSHYRFVLVDPGIHISTAWAFASIEPRKPRYAIEDVIWLPFIEWQEDGPVNDFEPAVTKEYPEIARIKNALYKAGAMYASMTGSGSTVYAIFMPETPIPTSVEEYPTIIVD